MNVQKTVDDTKSKLKQLWDENPVIVVVLAVASANAGSKLMRANTERKNAKTWRREVTRREQNSRKS